MDTVEDRSVDTHPTSETLPKLERGNKWQYDPEIRQWEVVMTPEHPKWGDHPLPDLPNPRHIHRAKSSLFKPLPADVSKRAKHVKLESEDGKVAVNVEFASDEDREEFGAVETWTVVLLPRHT